MSNRLMIVEDERIVALDLKNSLEYLGYEVVGMASSAHSAVEGARRLRPDLVLMDIHLEGEVDGTQAAREIHDSMRLPIIFLTAFAEEKTLARAELSTPYGYIIKPFELRELDATVRMALARRRVEQQVEQTEERLRLAMDAANLGVWEWNGRTSDLFVTGHLERILGDTPSVLREGRDSLLSRIHEADRDAVAQALDEGRDISATVRMHMRNGDVGWVDLHARAYPDQEADGSDARIIGVIRDVTERRANEERLRQASVVFDTTAEAILLLDADRKTISANPAFVKLTGLTLNEVRGCDPDDFLHARRHSEQFYPRLTESHDGYWLGEIDCRRSDGSVFPAWQHVCPVHDESGVVTHYVITFSDISALRRAEAQISHLAYHDALTGLGNRHMMEERLAIEIERCRGNNQHLGLLFLDLDGFKSINDTLGHQMGDELLRIIAMRVRGCVRRNDIAIRVGGDEFVVIVPELARVEDCAHLADKLLKQVRASVDLPHDQVSVSVSIGIAVFPGNADDRDGLLKAADSAMYSAKARGRNRYAFYAPDMAVRAQARMQMEQGLVRALQESRFSLHYQPMVSLADGSMLGMEALLRWQDPVLGAVEPERFIPVAEDSGLIEAIGEWVLRSACTQGAAWLRAGAPQLRLSINMSVRQMASEDLVERIAGILSETGFPANLLELEITESTLQSIEHSQGVLYRLRQLGITIAVDDFGTGFSSLGLLKHLPIDRIKIDRSFIRGLPDDASDLAITRAVVAIAASLDLQITAEGIETREQHELLRTLGCQSGQGFLFSRPVPAPELGRLLLPAGRGSPT